MLQMLEISFELHCQGCGPPKEAEKVGFVCTAF
jgi:hypothetical protein